MAYQRKVCYAWVKVTNLPGVHSAGQILNGGGGGGGGGEHTVSHVRLAIILYVLESTCVSLN